MLRIVLLALGAAWIAFAGPASAQQPVFNAILTKFANTTNMSAQIDVSLESTNGAQSLVDVTVFRADGTRDDFQVLTNANGFASTASVKDLFAAAAGQDALVQVRTPAGLETSNAILRQRSGKDRILLGVPVAQRASVAVGASTQFSIALGEVGRGAFLLIANVTEGETAEVTVHAGSVALPPRYTHPELGVHKIWRVPLTSAEARTHLVVRSTVPVIVQLAIDDGKIDEATIVAS